MEVSLINYNEVKDLFKKWGEFSCQCYNTPLKYAEKVGKHCLESGHFSGSRTIFFKFKITGISRACSLQLNRHKIGMELNQQSQRYCNMNGVDFVVPPSIQNNPRALELYRKLMVESISSYSQIQEILKEDGKNKEQSNEDARYCLLESCETQGTYGFTLEALIHFMNKRLCNRSQWEIRQLANSMIENVVSALPELKEYLVPHCKQLLWCPEGKSSCGLMPTKKEVEDKLKNS
ncbi:FAD-dependent thymidylate synthase [Clostridium botulinum]|uniref:FAD-dependent thymidylate synthase n=1 Tax=Clostridium botulinum TaxID=1491 RepID=UPI00174DC567|nr:FAD-dependent thymidylate synthase [Clostridium botulinum]MBD5589229.1 FAD-dependent thymidylate synthase [Clostridium botulinum]MBY6842718.1 FAD-dependent thymidylate synthase [Clostridium botulinum]